MMALLWLLLGFGVEAVPRQARSDQIVRGNCLDLVYARGGAPSPDEQSFDLANDWFVNVDASLSCVAGVSASRVRRDLDQLRNAVMTADRRLLEPLLLTPLWARVSSSEFDPHPRSIRIRNVDDWLRFQRRYFTVRHREIIECTTLKQVEPLQGSLSLGRGFLWLAEFGGVRRLRITGVTVWPLSEADVRKACSSGGGR